MLKFKTILVLAITILVFTNSTYSQNADKPKLVVGIVVDQMRYDYLNRFADLYTENGFKRLLAEGTNFTYAHYNYSLTKTGPGHTTIYTGTSPYYHGIMSNDWYDKNTKQMTNCVDDASVKSVGSDDEVGKKSPHLSMSTTITDQLKLSTNGTSKVVSVSIKDRAAILPGGKMADVALWYDGYTGDFISSTYYCDKLPEWVNEFNNKNLPDEFLKQDWTLSNPESDYARCAADNSDCEYDVFNEGKTSFPHSFAKVDEKERYDVLTVTPFANTLVAELAKTALVSENLGKGSTTDFLAVSFSAPDAIGHSYGTESYEIEDTYIKLDITIADLLETLDEQVGKGNYLLFLTADHGAVTTPAILKERHLPTGTAGSREAIGDMLSFLKNKFGVDNLIENHSNSQIYLDREVMAKNDIDIHEAERVIADYLRDRFPTLAAIFTRDELEKLKATRLPDNTILNGFNVQRSGDVLYDLQPGYISGNIEKGTTHGTPYNYDTHVPMIFYGWNISQQAINDKAYTVDIAATVADLLGITEPSACVGIPLIKK